MDVHALNEVRERLDRAGRATRFAATALLGALLANAALGLFAHAFSPVLAALAVAAGVVTAWTVGERRDLVERLAMDGSAYAIPDVRRAGTRLTRADHRLALADWLLEVLVEAGRPDSIYLAERVRSNEQLLRRLAEDLRSPSLAVAAPSLVACTRLLTRAAESPLYNPYLPAESLALALRRIRLGVSRG